jgi:hypothetical protein
LEDFEMRPVFLPVFLLVLCGPIAHAEVIDLEGTVKAVDVDARTVTIERKTASGAKTMTVDVAASAGDLQTITPDAAVKFSYDNKLEVVTAIETGDEGSQLFVAGSEWATEDDGLRIRVIHVEGDSFVGLMYGKAPQLRELHGKIQGTKVFWLAKDVVALKGSPGADNFGTIQREKQGARIDFRYGDGIDKATQTFTVKLVVPAKATAN